jgi:hypothetical protein
MSFEVIGSRFVQRKHQEPKKMWLNRFSRAPPPLPAIEMGGRVYTVCCGAAPLYRFSIQCTCQYFVIMRVSWWGPPLLSSFVWGSSVVCEACGGWIVLQWGAIWSELWIGTPHPAGNNIHMLHHTLRLIHHTLPLQPEDIVHHTRLWPCGYLHQTQLWIIHTQLWIFRLLWWVCCCLLRLCNIRLRRGVFKYGCTHPVAPPHPDVVMLESEAASL